MLHSFIVFDFSVKEPKPNPRNKRKQEKEELILKSEQTKC